MTADPATTVMMIVIVVLGIVLDFWWKRVRGSPAAGPTATSAPMATSVTDRRGRDHLTLRPC